MRSLLNIFVSSVRYIFLGLFFVLFLCDNGVSSEEPIVTCEDGVLQGTYLKTKGGRTINAFMGIPYAKPPVGELRFKAPVSNKWTGILNASKIHPVCPQRDIYRRADLFEGEEDCLYLNIYTPTLPNPDTELLPVMIFFHGGGWLCGGGNLMWYGPQILLDRDVVLVVTNYRLGPLGFLSTGDEEVSGNNGLKDQNLALKFVQRNIKAFGGDPGNVTLFGESAGGASVHYHMLSPMSRGLFHRGISMSGTSQSIWAYAPKGESVANSKKLAEALNCPTYNSTEMVKCLRTIDAMDMIKKDVIFMKWDFDPMIPFKPTVEPNVEGAFLTQDPVEIIKSGKSQQTPLIIGITSEDGALRAAGIAGNPQLMDELNKDFETLAPISLMYDKTASYVKTVTKKIRNFYFGDDGQVTSKKINELVNMYTDGWFLNAADETIRLHKKYSKNPVYAYVFGHRGVASFTKIFGGGDYDYGVCHADDLQYLFPVGDSLFPDSIPTKDDKCVTKLFTTLWTNFAKTGDPTPDLNDVIPEKWSAVEQTENIEYYYIDAKSPEMRKGFFTERAKFWRTLDSNPRLSDNKVNRDEL